VVGDNNFKIRLDVISGVGGNMGVNGANFKIKKQISNRDTINVAGDFRVSYTQNELNEKFIIPFEVSKKTFEEKTLFQLSQGAFTPDDILIKSMDKCIFRGVFIPVYYFKGNYSAFLTYTAIFNIEEPYSDYEIEYRDGESQRIPVTKFRIREDKHPLEKNISDTYTELAIAMDFFTLLNTGYKTTDLILFCEKLSYDQYKIKKFQDDLIEGFEKIPFSIDSNEAELKIKERIRKKIKKNIYNGLQGDSQRNIHLHKPININVDDIKKIYLPFWFAIYSYNNKKSLFVMDGSKSSRIYNYNKPKDVKRIVNLLGLIIKIYFSFLFIVLICLAIITFIGEAYSLENWYIKFLEIISTNFISIVAYSAIITLPIGIIKSIFIIKKSEHIREEILKKMK